MKIVQIIKKLNNTELGKSGTHETYVQVPQNLEIADLFTRDNVIENFVYKKNRKNYRIRSTVGREKRIVGLGEFYRENDVCAGDELVLEKHISGDSSTYFIDLNKKSNIVVLQRCKSGFELLNSDRKVLITDELITFHNGEWVSIKLEFLGAEKKRADSQDTTDIYDFKVNNISLVNNFTRNEMIEIEVDFTTKQTFISKVCIWQKYVFETEEENA